MASRGEYVRTIRLLQFFLLIVLAAPACRELLANPLVIAHVTVIDVSTGKALPNRNVVIQGDRVAAVGAGTIKPEKGVAVIEGYGKFLIPGLWDMHIHL